MAAPSSGTQRVTQPMIALHDRTGASTFPCSASPAPAALTPAVDRTPQRPPAPRRTAPAVVGIVCLLLGVAIGHEAREGRAYASGLEGVAHRASAAPSLPRERRVASTAGAVTDNRARAKDAPALPAQPLLHRPAKPRARAGVGRPAAPVAPDALFVDFEPSFRVDR